MKLNQQLTIIPSKINIERFKPFYLLKNEQSNIKSVKSVKKKSQNRSRFWDLNTNSKFKTYSIGKISVEVTASKTSKAVSAILFPLVSKSGFISTNSMQTTFLLSIIWLIMAMTSY